MLRCNNDSRERSKGRKKFCCKNNSQKSGLTPTGVVMDASSALVSWTPCSVQGRRAPETPGRAKTLSVETASEVVRFEDGAKTPRTDVGLIDWRDDNEKWCADVPRDFAVRTRHAREWRGCRCSRRRRRRVSNNDDDDVFQYWQTLSTASWLLRTTRRPMGFSRDHKNDD